MQIKDFNIPDLIENAKKHIAEDTGISKSTKATFELILILVALFFEKKLKNSRNSSIPPSQDPNRLKKLSEKKNTSGGQLGHKGATLKKVDHPDEIIEIFLDRRTLAKGHNYHNEESESRQVKDYEILVKVIEYRAEVLVDENGKRYVAEFPYGVTSPIQYGPAIKANAVYMNCFQMCSLDRIQDHFSDQLNINLSQGSIYNFSAKAYIDLQPFVTWVSEKLLTSDLCHADETGINVGGKRIWLHTLCNAKYTYFFPHENRGCEAMNEMGILPKYTGQLCHDHWKAYYTYKHIMHYLCNSHHLRELQGVFETENHSWSNLMKKFLIKLNQKVDENGGVLSDKHQKKARKMYRAIVEIGEKECPQPIKEEGKRGRVKKTKERNLLERLRDFEDDTLGFMTDIRIPFTNNQGENDLRMTKVQQKVSGCFRSMEGAKIFAVIRSYINTCRKHGIGATEALRAIYDGKLEYILSQMDEMS